MHSSDIQVTFRHYKVIIEGTINVNPINCDYCYREWLSGVINLRRKNMTWKNEGKSG